VIEDIEGATSEPTRRAHVLVLSALVASLSLVLLFALVMPRSRVEAPAQAASSAPSLTAAQMLTVAANPGAQRLVDLTGLSECASGRRLTPPYNLVIEAGTGRIFLDQAGSSLPIAFVADPPTGRLTVKCATPGAVVPRIDRAR
jgi:hypothetical protein